ncbi:NAD-P-binding protein [Boletus reticuloceps]|uniref:NAD-P-binding protein n=1 Tax=Boletus reticuloceps TaxID=495285 RepID=A0A8I3A6S6_9AGAM|nr:NAD-P-binding protein [Boletus reticuloceps]
MAPIRNARQIFNEIPTDYPVPGRTVVYDTSQTIDLEDVPLRGGILLRTLVLSIDPYLRNRMRDMSIKSYMPAFQLGESLQNFGVGVVVRSENPAFKAGEHVYAILPFEEYSVHTQVEDLYKIENNHKLPWTAFVGTVGMPGQTAYCAWKEYAQAKKVGGSGIHNHWRRRGRIVCRPAREARRPQSDRLGGLRRESCIYEEIGADVAFNYKTTSTSEVLEKEGPIDVFWDNVGGEALEAALGAAAKDARFIECGMISEYNVKPYPVMVSISILRPQ